ncbi:MAG: hypothetical protein K1X47_11310 [Cyclobacteriaceae bacterium]|nr:hypothetical protein [Cyclobacteriaceae bacterium]
MKSIRPALWILMASALAGGCFTPPTFPVVPLIEFDKVEFQDVKDPSASDTLTLSIKFKDGDGDLGIDQSETEPPFHDRTYFIESGNNLITYETKRTVAGYDSLPNFVTPYNCLSWDVIAKDTTVSRILFAADPGDRTVLRKGKYVPRTTDTLYYQLNPYRNNMVVEMLVKNADGSFKPFDVTGIFKYPNCLADLFSGRFPILAKDLSQKSPLEGTIHYKMQSAAFTLFFSIKVLKIRVYIYDRAFHKSNVIETPEFTLQSIKK